MKRQVLYATVLLMIAGLLMTNAYVGIEYRVNLLEYMQLSSDYTAQEKAALKRISPLVYGGNISEPPLGIYNAENGQYTGMVVDYISALSIELGETIVSRPMIWNEALQALEAGETDICDMIPSEERQKTFAFSAPVYDLNGSVIVPIGKGSITRPNQLNGRRVVVQKGDFAIEYMTRSGIRVELVQVDNMSEAMLLLKKGSVEAAVGDEPVAYHYLSALGMTEGFQVLDTPLYRNRVSLGVSKDNQELLQVLDKAIFKLRQKGILAQIQNKWNKPTPDFYRDSSADKLRLTLTGVALVFSILLYLTWIWSRSLKLLVGIRTRELEYMKNELQVVFDSMSSLLAVISGQGTLVSLNGAFLKALGCEEDALLDKAFTEIDMLRAFDEVSGHGIKKWLEAPEDCSFEEKYEFRHGGRILVCRCSPLEQEGVSSGQLLLMISDETVSRMQEMRLIHANKMETVGMLAAGVAHELRNPLGIIRNSGFVLKTLDPEDTAYRHTALMAIETSVTRASKIIENLLKHSRLTDDRKDRIHLRAFLEEILGLFDRQLNEKNVRLALSCPEGVTIISNSASLWHGILNIIQNALDAMPQGGELKITVIGESERVTIRLCDTGTGISPENLDRIFNPFFTTKPVGQGTGLGLYVAYSEIQKAGGIIEVTSEPGQGTCFNLHIRKGAENYADAHEAADC